MLIDTHAHIQFDTYDGERDEMLQRAADAGVEYVICPGIDLATSRQAVALADRYDAVFAAVGVHPHDCEDLPEDWLKQLEALADHPGVVAIGEIGLDYFKEYTPREAQHEAFRQQLELAASLGMPVIVHNRESDEDMERLMSAHGDGSGVLHCYASTLDLARRMVDRGYLISFTGIATFGNKTVESTIRGLDLADIMVETDSPFLAPVPKRGRTNEPAYVRYVADKVAELQEVTPEEVVRVTTENARRCFSLPV